MIMKAGMFNVAIISPWKRVCLVFEQTCITFILLRRFKNSKKPLTMTLTSLVEIGQMVPDKKILNVEMFKC